MVTGSLCFPLFLDISPFGGWLREMVTGSLCFPVFLSVSPFGGWLREMVTGSLWVMVTGDGYGKSLFSFFSSYFSFQGDGYGRWLREVFVFLFFLIFLLLGDGSGRLCFPFFLDISPFGEDSLPLIRRTSINPIVGRTAKTSSV